MSELVFVLVSFIVLAAVILLVAPFILSGIISEEERELEERQKQETLP